jgi:prevent-host-death family protein
MERVGIRELKGRLSHYLRAVRRGQALIVTQRGEPIARLVPISPTGRSGLPTEVESRLWELTSQGLTTWNGTPHQLPGPVAVNRSDDLLSDLVVEDRE